MKTKQHTKPCRDCPWRRNATAGWVGSENTPEKWVEAAHGEVIIDCHTGPPGSQCAGNAIFRANVCKSPRTDAIIHLPPDPEHVFESGEEFIRYHRRNGEPTSAEAFQEMFQEKDAK